MVRANTSRRVKLNKATATVVTADQRTTRTASVSGNKTYIQTEFGMAVFDRPFSVVELVDFICDPLRSRPPVVA
jgi:hypothetical protein